MFLAALVTAVLGPVLSAGLFTYYASTADDISAVTVALLGLIGTFISSGTALYLTMRTHQKVENTNERVESVERKVSAPRRISASSGEDGEVVVQPPEEDNK